MKREDLKRRFENYEVQFDSSQVKKQVFEQLDGENCESSLKRNFALLFSLLGLLIGGVTFNSVINQGNSEETYSVAIPPNVKPELVDTLRTSDDSSVPSTPVKAANPATQNKKSNLFSDGDFKGKLSTNRTTKRTSEGRQAEKKSSPLYVTNDYTVREFKAATMPRVKNSVADKIEQTPKSSKVENVNSLREELKDQAIVLASKSALLNATTKLNSIFPISTLVTELQSDLRPVLLLEIPVATFQSSGFRLGITAQILNDDSGFDKIFFGADEPIMEVTEKYVGKAHYKFGVLAQHKVKTRILLEHKFLFGVGLSEYSYRTETNSESVVTTSAQTRAVTITETKVRRYRQDDLLLEYHPKIVWEAPTLLGNRLTYAIAGGPSLIYDISDTFYVTDGELEISTVVETPRLLIGYELSARLGFDLSSGLRISGSLNYSFQGSSSHKLRPAISLPIALELAVLRIF